MRMGDLKGEEGVESGDQEVEGKFSFKVFSNKRIIMQRSHSSPSALPPFHPHSLSLPLILSPHPHFLLIFLSQFSLSALLL